MRKSLLFASILFLGFAILMAPTFIKRSDAAATQTGQGIMVNLNAQGTYAIVQTNTYKYTEGTAATYFTNTWDDSVPVGVANKNTCVSPPAAPLAPAPISGEVTAQQAGSAVSQNQCIFLDGGTLLGHSYQQLSTNSGVNCGDPI
jgi:hypothetical protein